MEGGGAARATVAAAEWPAWSCGGFSRARAPKGKGEAHRVGGGARDSRDILGRPEDDRGGSEMEADGGEERGWRRLSILTDLHWRGRGNGGEHSGTQDDALG